MAMTDLSSPTSVEITKTGDGSYMDWPAVFSGTVLAAAISLVLITFGSAIGLSLTSAHENTGISFAGFSIAAALWLVWVQVSGFMAGGYLTGRMRRRNYDATEHESDIRDGAHGLTVWGLGVLVGAAIAFSGATAAVSTATTAATSVVGGAVAGAANAADDVLGGGQLLVDRLFRPAPQAGAAAEGAAAEGAAPAASAASPAESADTTAQRQEIGRILVSAVTSGTLEDADRQYIIDTVAARTGLPPEEVQKRADQMWTQAQELEAKAREAADHARRIAVIAAFITAASLLIGAAGAYFGAVMGGNHRDKQVVVEGWVRPWA